MESSDNVQSQDIDKSILSDAVCHILTGILVSKVNTGDTYLFQKEAYRLLDQELKNFLGSLPPSTSGGEGAGQETFSICGICSARDVVTLLGNQVNRFVQDVNPISLQYRSPTIKELPFTGESICSYLQKEENQFNTRNILLDANKSVYHYLLEVKSDWLILDSGCLRLNLLVDQEHNSAVTKFLWNKLNLQLPRGQYQTVDVNDLSDLLFEKCMDEYLDHMLQVYDESQIIVMDFHMADKYVDRQRRRLRIFGHDCDKGNRAISRGFWLMQKRLPHAHFIPFLDNAIGDENHKWGMYPLHFVQECYEYGAEAIRIVQKRFSPQKERALLYKLKAYYQNKIAFHYLTFLQDTDPIILDLEMSDRRTSDNQVAHLHQVVNGASFPQSNAIASEASAGTSFLCVLIQLLEICRPQKLLEFEFDDVTQVISQYAEATEAQHHVFDWDRVRVMALLQKWNLPIHHTEIHGSNPIPVRRQEQDAIIYPAFSQLMQDHPERKYDFILLKRSAVNQGELPSSDIMPHLPQLLAPNFIIFVDGVNHHFEHMMADDIRYLLEDNGISFQIHPLSDGENNACVIISKKWGELMTQKSEDWF